MESDGTLNLVLVAIAVAAFLRFLMRLSATARWLVVWGIFAFVLFAPPFDSSVLSSAQSYVQTLLGGGVVLACLGVLEVTRG
jgi:hypothetical protein